MTTFVCNTLSGAVTEYTRHYFHSITARHCAGVDGFFTFGGDNDAGLPITTELRLPATLRENTLKQQIAMVYLSMQGEGEAQFTVFGPQGQSWSYPFPLRDSGQTRCPVGKGIRENYLGFGLSTPDGQAFTLDRVEVMSVKSKTRRV